MSSPIENPGVVGSEEHGERAHLRVLNRDENEDASDDDGSHERLSRPPSTLPPPPFGSEVDVMGHEWWLDAHMTAASNLLCLRQFLDGISQIADVIAIEHIESLFDNLVRVRDALYELYCDAADPRMHSASSLGTPLAGYIVALYQWSEGICLVLLDLIGRLRTKSPEFEELARVAHSEPLLFLDHAKEAIRGRMKALAVNSENPVEPLRNLDKDVEEMFAAASALEKDVSRLV